MLRKMGTDWETPATIVNSLINGPGYYLTAPIPIPIPLALNERLMTEVGYSGSPFSGS